MRTVRLWPGQYVRVELDGRNAKQCNYGAAGGDPAGSGFEKLRVCGGTKDKVVERTTGRGVSHARRGDVAAISSGRSIRASTSSSKVNFGFATACRVNETMAGQPGAGHTSICRNPTGKAGLDEHLRALHPPAGRDHPDVGRADPGAGCSPTVPAGRGAAAAPISPSSSSRPSCPAPRPTPWRRRWRRR